MAISETQSSSSLIPNFLYSSSSILHSTLPSQSPSQSFSAPMNPFPIPSPTDPTKKLEMYSPAFYAACAFGGSLSCGLTHTALTPLDLVKCNMQVGIWLSYKH
uniref:Uncharacterized protein n=1 Tax=Cucumis sativus TaxID=3659 RepID=A0A0A0L8G5_CUCSA